ncbi:MAG: hypothetical protein RQ741_07750 [Wenzhouxiangellaceae bacterium]|nr:hypothetical protein [Wenzhouxiangellaceae bacterium]
MTRLLTIFLIASMALAGCKDSGPGPDQQDAKSSPPARTTGSGNPFLELADRESAYLYANLQRLPDSVIDKIWAINDATAAGNDAMFDAMVEDEDMPSQARALVRELKELSTREGWENAGLHSNPNYLVHAVSLYPFAHLELSDDAAFEALIARVEARLETPLERRDVEGVEVIWIGIESGIGIALRHDQRMLTAAVIPDTGPMLSRAAGLTGPLDPLDEETMESFNRDTGLTVFGSGYADWRRVVAEILDGDAIPGEGDQLAAIRDEPACAVEFQALTTALPRLVFGYNRLNEKHADFLARQETSTAIGQGIAAIARAPVSIDRELSGLFSAGLAIDLVKGREFARGLVDGWVQNPPTCPAFAEIAKQAPTMQQGLNRPIPPIVTNLQGIFLEAQSLELGPGGIPTGGGTFSLFMNNPQLLVGMAQMFSPAVAQLQLEPGGEAQKIPPEALPQLESFGVEAWMAMAENAIGIAVGESHIDALMEQITATDADDLLLTGKLDFDTMIQLIEMAEDTLGGGDSTLGLEGQRAQYEAIAEVYEQAGFKIRLAENGIDFVAETTMK